MKPFNLEEAKQGKPVVTRDGRPVRILTFDKKGDYCIVTLIKYCRSNDVCVVYREDGKASATFDSEYDLFMKAEKRVGWVNVYRGHNENSRTAGAVFNTELEALQAGNDQFNYITTIKVEWEE